MKHQILSYHPDICNPITINLNLKKSENLNFHSSGVISPLQASKIMALNYNNQVTQEEFKQLPDMLESCYQNAENIEKPDILQFPVFLVSERLKQLCLHFDPHLIFKGVSNYSVEGNDSDTIVYWKPFLEKVSCLSSQVEKYPNGWTKRLVLREKPMQGKHIFVVDGVYEYTIIVSLELAEHMLRSGLWGMKFLPVELGVV